MRAWAKVLGCISQEQDMRELMSLAVSDKIVAAAQVCVSPIPHSPFFGYLQ